MQDQEYEDARLATAVAVPLEHRPEDGAAESVRPLEDPQAPKTGAGGGGGGGVDPELSA